MNLPPISHLQFAVLDSLGAETLTGKQLRSRLTRSGIKKSGPSFYQMMARLEEAKLLDGWYDQKIVDGQIIKERSYRATPDGVKAVKATVQFYKGAQ